jgi:hypothetical protein
MPSVDRWCGFPWLSPVLSACLSEWDVPQAP